MKSAATATQPARARKVPAQSRSRQMVDIIMRATARVLAEEGWDRTTTNRIAARAGVSVGSLYQYFSSKEDLIEAIVDRTVQEQRAQLLEAAGLAMGLDVEGGARVIIGALLAKPTEEQLTYRVVLEQIPPMAIPEAIRRLNRETVMVVQAYLAAFAPQASEAERSRAAFVVVHSLDALAKSALIHRPEWFASGELLEESVALATRYLGGLVTSAAGRSST